MKIGSGTSNLGIPTVQPGSPQDTGNRGKGPGAGPVDSFEKASQPTAFALGVSVQVSGMGALQSFGKVPEVDGSAAGWQKYNDALSSRVSGGRADQLLLGAGNPWTQKDANFQERITVGWAMQQNPNVKYDADSKNFYVQDANGNRQNVATLDEMEKVVQNNGGFDQNNGGGMKALGSALAARVAGVGTAGPSSATVVVVGESQNPAANAGGAQANAGGNFFTDLFAKLSELLTSLFGGGGQAGDRLGR